MLHRLSILLLFVVIVTIVIDLAVARISPREYRERSVESFDFIPAAEDHMVGEYRVSASDDKVIVLYETSFAVNQKTYTGRALIPALNPAEYAVPLPDERQVKYGRWEEEPKTITFPESLTPFAVFLLHGFLYVSLVDRHENGCVQVFVDGAMRRQINYPSQYYEKNFFGRYISALDNWMMVSDMWGVHIYRRANWSADWVRHGYIRSPTDTPLFGFCTDISDDFCVVSSPFEGPGRVYLYRRSRGEPMVIDAPRICAEFGSKVKIAGDSLIVSSDAGVDIFTLPSCELKSSMVINDVSYVVTDCRHNITMGDGRGTLFCAKSRRAQK